VHINVICPKCNVRLRMADTMRGIRVRCPNQACGATFEVQEAGESAPPAPAAPAAPARPAVKPPPSHGSGSVGDMVPILTAEQANAAPAPKPPGRGAQVQNHVANELPMLQAEVAQGTPSGAPAEPTDWRSAPPPAKRGAGPAPAATPAAPPPPQTPAPDPSDWRSAPPPAKRQPGAAPAAATPPAPAPRAAAAPAAAPAPAADPSDWRSAPPPAKRQAGDATPAAAAGPPPRRAAAAHEAPPARRLVAESPAAPLVPDAFGAAARAKRRNKLLMYGVVGGSVLILAVAFGTVWTILGNTEAAIRKRAEDAYTLGQFAKASSEYKNLVESYPESSQHADDQARLDLCNFRTQAESAVIKPENALDLAEHLIKGEGLTEADKSKQRELAQEYGQSLEKLLKNVADAVKGGDDVSKSEAWLKRARDLVTLVPPRFPTAFAPEQQAGLTDALQQAEDHLVKVRTHNEAVKALAELMKHPSGQAVKQAATLVRQQAEKEPGFDQNGEVTDLLRQLQDGHLRSVVYAQADQPPGAGRGEDRVPSLLVAPRLDVGVDPGGRDDGTVVFALARGVLYALSQKTGRIVWAMRVGIDSATLPVRVAASGARPEMVLVPSTDTETLTALNAATGDQLWKYRLGAPCVGRPLIVDQWAYVPTYDGKVHEIELVGGKLRGWYDLGNRTRLTVGGARQEGTRLLYFPADEHCVYVLDVANHRCQTILYTQHLAGTLRSEPILATPTGKFQNVPLDPPNAPEGYLILCLADGFQNMTLRVFGLPIDSPNKPPLRLNPEPRLPGWPWFGPSQDPEKLVLATDAGEVGVFGIRQPGNADNALFPWLPKEFRVAPGAGGGRPGRAQVVHAQEDDIWVIVHGALRRLQLAFDPADGQKLTEVWKEPLRVGSPLHGSQVDRAGETLFVVTQALNRQQCLATAVNAETGDVRWQRQLGFVCRGQPVVLGDQVLALDQAGGVFAFSPAGHPPPENPDEVAWGVGGQSLARPPGLEDNAAFPPALYPVGDGVTAYQAAVSRGGDALLLRRFELNAKGDKIDLKDEKQFEPLPAPPAGMPAVGPDELLLPLEDGTLYGVRLPGGAADMSGLQWRPGRAQAGMRCQLAWVAAGKFLSSDGSRGLTLWTRDKAGWHASRTVADSDDPTILLPARIVAPPAVLSAQAGDLKVCVADANGGLTLLAGDDLKEGRHWNLGGKITAGPFVYGGLVGCVVDRSLVWIDPATDQPLWTYAAPEEIVGRPQFLGGLLVVADQSGRFVAVDPATGKEAGKGYTVKASAAPAAGVAPFGKDRAFAALTDGTVMLLSLDHLRPAGK
jgi:outer membrane protein assembly factor BamB